MQNIYFTEDPGFKTLKKVSLEVIVSYRNVSPKVKRKVFSAGSKKQKSQISKYQWKSSSP